MTPELAIALFNMFGPMIYDIIGKFHKDNGRLPTPEEVQAEFQANLSKLDSYLAEGAQWKATHPDQQ